VGGPAHQTYSKVPAIDSAPSIFVTAMDTNPLAADPAVIIAQRSEDFANGLTLLTRLTQGPVNLCVAADATVPGDEVDGVRVVGFSRASPSWSGWNPYPFIDPVSAEKTVWTIGYQDVIAMVRCLPQANWITARVVALAGPQVVKPRLLTTQLGCQPQSASDW